MNGYEQGEGLVFPDFEMENEEALGELLGEEALQQVMLNEIVIECPVVIEFVGGGSSLDTRNQFLQAAMSQLRSAIRNQA